MWSRSLSNSYTFNLEPSGFVAVEEDQGKHNNRSFGYQISKETLDQIHSDSVVLLMCAKSKIAPTMPLESIEISLATIESSSDLKAAAQVLQY